MREAEKQRKEREGGRETEKNKEREVDGRCIMVHGSVCNEEHCYED